MGKLTAKDVIKILDLTPHPEEGGYFRETYRSTDRLSKQALSDRYLQDHSISTAIYYLLTPETFSCLHRLASDEIFHFYMGDSVEMLWLKPDGTGETVILGQDLAAGECLQVVVPAGFWQGSRLKDGVLKNGFALLGCTVAPGFEYADYEVADRDDLLEKYSDYKDVISKLTFSLN